MQKRLPTNEEREARSGARGKPVPILSNRETGWLHGSVVVRRQEEHGMDNPQGPSLPPEDLFLVCPAENSRVRFPLHLDRKVVWLTRQDMASIFQPASHNISLDLHYIVEERRFAAPQLSRSPWGFNSMALLQSRVRSSWHLPRPRRSGGSRGPCAMGSPSLNRPRIQEPQQAGGESNEAAHQLQASTKRNAKPTLSAFRPAASPILRHTAPLQGIRGDAPQIAPHSGALNRPLVANATHAETPLPRRIAPPKLGSSWSNRAGSQTSQLISNAHRTTH